MSTRSIPSAAILLTALLAACSIVAGQGRDPTRDVDRVPEPRRDDNLTLEAVPTVSQEILLEMEEASIGITHQQLDGNRLVFGVGNMPTEPVDVPLLGVPLWVVGVPLKGAGLWLAVLESGAVQAFQMSDHDVFELRLNLSALPAGTPPVLIASDGGAGMLPLPPDASQLTHPVPSPDDGLAHIDIEGSLRIRWETAESALSAEGLADARILVDETRHLLFLSGPSAAYPHGALGDSIESTTITLVDVTEDPLSARIIGVTPGDVVEGIAPIWVDLNGDGEREIIVTQSNARAGARLVVYREDGALFAEGDPIGQGFRWRHQIAAGQFIPGGPLEIAVVRTPHIGGVLELYVLEGESLVVEAQREGFRSHQIGSRNLDSALAGDFNGDGILEVVLPDQAQRNLVGVQMVHDELEVIWEVPLDGSLRTNLAAVYLPDDGIALAAGVDTGLLRIWLPR